MERSLVLIKPDAVERNLIGKVISYYEEAGLKVVNIKMLQISRELAEKHYECHKGKDFYEKLIKYITRSPLCAMIVEGNDAIERVRKINGATRPDEAEYGTIRRAIGIDGTENSVHSSDSLENAQYEIKLWFGDE